MRHPSYLHAEQPAHANGAVSRVAVGDQSMVWLNALIGWARRGDRRHAWICIGGATVLFGIMVGA